MNTFGSYLRCRACNHLLSDEDLIILEEADTCEYCYVSTEELFPELGEIYDEDTLE